MMQSVWDEESNILFISDVDGEVDVPLDVMVLTFVQYWRLRVLARRVASEDMEDLSATFLAGIGIPLPGGPTKVFLSRESCLMSSLMTISGMKLHHKWIV